MQEQRFLQNQEDHGKLFILKRIQKKTEALKREINLKRLKSRVYLEEMIKESHNQ